MDGRFVDFGLVWNLWSPLCLVRYLSFSFFYFTLLYLFLFYFILIGQEVINALAKKKAEAEALT